MSLDRSRHSNRQAIVVLKLGSSVLRHEDDLPRAVSEIYRWVRQGHRVVAVVSAFGGATDRLLAAAHRVADAPAAEPLAALLATGETRSAALLSLALDRAGIPARLLDPAGLRLVLKGPRLDGEPVAVALAPLLAALRAAPVAVLPGFFGVSEDGGLGLLGRGGSDLTALFVADALKASRCRLLKNVSGVYVRDPEDRGSAPATEPLERYRTLSFESAGRLEGRVLQRKAIRFAQRAGRSFEVAAPADDWATQVGRGPDARELAHTAHHRLRRLRVGLLGLGTVGAGVYQQLQRWPERFEVVGIAVRDPAKQRAIEVTAPLFADPWQVLALQPDVIVEALGGREPATELLAEALRRGCQVVTANKAVVAAEGARLQALAAEGNVALRFSAAVGGGVAVLEATRQAAHTGRVRSVSGVLNGTCNFVLDRIAEGATSADAIRSAQLRGLAEADPSDDLRGIDSAHKLVLIAREAFDVWLPLDQVRCRGIEDLDANAVREAAARGRTIRLVATCVRTQRGIRAAVEPRLLAASHPLARCRDEDNVVKIVREDGSAVTVSGKGAGRWPTSESVLADLLEVSRWHEARETSTAGTGAGATRDSAGATRDSAGATGDSAGATGDSAGATWDSAISSARESQAHREGR